MSDQRSVSSMDKEKVGADAVVVKDSVSGWKGLLTLTAVSIGIIYGDIGTSPLYVMNAIFPSSGGTPSEEDVVGAISAIIWAITLLPLIKYSLICLRFGNGSNEGGPMALYTAIYPRAEDSEDQRTLTSYTTSSYTTNPSKAASLFDLKWVRRGLLAWVLFGTSLTLSDGLLTPAVSVVSAVGGIAVAAPAVTNNIVGISVAILVLLFSFQVVGTNRVGIVFAPVVAVWLLLIGISGVINLTAHPAIFKAFSPHYAILWFVRTGQFDNLAGVLLCVTGCEALFANLGQFSRASIQLGFTTFVYPCLILAYLGQGSQLIVNGDAVIANVFFQTIPGGVGSGFWWFTFVFAILAAVIASQAMISASFSLVQQLIHYRAIPSFKMIHTSSYFPGQIFVPIVNFLLFCGTIGFTVGFGTDAGLTNAYGFSVATVLIVTTTFIAISMVRVKHYPLWVALAFMVFFGFVDGLFWAASLKKIPLGAYAPFAIGIVLTTFFLFWSWVRGLEDQFDETNRKRLTEIIQKPEEEEEMDEVDGGRDGGIRMRVMKRKLQTSVKLIGSDTVLNRLPVFALFHNLAGNAFNGAPPGFNIFLKCYPSLPSIVVFFSVFVLETVAYVPEEERFVVSRVRTFDGMYICKYRVGYRDIVDLNRNMIQEIRNRIVSIEASSGEEGFEEKIAIMDDCIEHSVTHIIPSFYVSAAKSYSRFGIINYIRKVLIEVIYRRIQSDDTASYIIDNETILRIAVPAAL